MRDDGAGEPEQDARRVADVEQLQERPGDQRQRGEVREQMQRGGAVAPAHVRNSIRPTHFVLCTPGRPGTMIRAG